MLVQSLYIVENIKNIQLNSHDQGMIQNKEMTIEVLLILIDKIGTVSLK